MLLKQLFYQFCYTAHGSFHKKMNWILPTDTKNQLCNIYLIYAISAILIQRYYHNKYYSIENNENIKNKVKKIMNNDTDFGRLTDAFLITIINHITFGTVLFVVNVVGITPFKPEFELWELLSYLPVIILIYEVLTYFIHRAFHTPLLYKFHKRHHSWVYSEPMATFDCHPVEHIFINILPITVAIIWTNMSLGNIYLIIIYGINNSVKAHSGWLPHTYHYIHHFKQKMNYGSSLRFMDWIFGTD